VSDFTADRPGPKLTTLPHQCDVVGSPSSQRRPDLIGDHEVHDDDRAAEDQMKMSGDPRCVVDHRVHAVAHINRHQSNQTARFLFNGSVSEALAAEVSVGLSER
jgi:hypothetical protein